MKKGFKDFLVKTGIFTFLFILFSFLIGTQLYQYGILEDWKISIYGRIGYILLFSIAGFILLYRDRLLQLKSFKFRKIDLIFILSSFLFLVLFYFFEMNAYKFSLSFLNIFLVHFVGVFIFVFLCLGVYGVRFVFDFVKSFKREIFYFLIFGLIVYFFMNLVFGLWFYLSWVVLKCVYFLLSFGNVLVVNSNTLIFEGFAVQIAEACSGIYSIFIFTSLYLFVVLLDWDKLNHLRALFVFVPAVVGAFLVNVLRVFLMMIVGAYVSKGVALGLYHSYVGMIFFLIYFGIFWGLLYGWMKKFK